MGVEQTNSKYADQLHIVLLCQNAAKMLPTQNFDSVDTMITAIYVFSIFSSSKSIGRFCSNNLVQQRGAGILFDMYSYDGHAKIKFHSDGSHTGKGFSLSYRLRKATTNYIGFSDCFMYVCLLIFLSFS